MQMEQSELQGLQELAEDELEAFNYGWESVDSVDELASEEDVLDFADEVFDIYDELLGVETDETMRDEMKDAINYDLDLLDRAKLAVSPTLQFGTLSAVGGSTMLGAISLTPSIPFMNGIIPLTGLALGAGTALGAQHIYRRITEDGHYEEIDNPFGGQIISISKDRKAKDSAYPTVLSEVLHAYQDLHSSPTYNDMHLREGMDRAVKTRASEILADRGYEDIDWDWNYRSYRAETLAHAYSILRGEDDEENLEALQELGFDEYDAETLVEDIHKTRKSNFEEYTVGSSAVFLAEKEYGDQAYQEVFHGNFDILPDWFEPQPIYRGGS